METANPRKRRRSGVLLPSLRRLRVRRGWTQEELARRADIERATVSNLESGKRAALPLTISKLCDALGVAPEELTSATKDQETLFPTTTEDRGVAYLNALRKLLNRLDRRLEDAIDAGELDMTMAEWAARVEADIWERVLPEMRLTRGIGGMTREERDAHELVHTALQGFGSTVHDAYNAAVRNLTGQRADVVGFDKLQGAMEDRDKARSEWRRRLEEAEKSA